MRLGSVAVCWELTRLAAHRWMILDAPVGEGGASPLRGGDRWQRELGLGARCRRSPALANRRRDYPYSPMNTEGF